MRTTSGAGRDDQPLAAVVESTDDAIYSKTLGGVILTWNAAAETLFGYTADEIIGRSVSLLEPGDRPLEMEDILVRVRRGERVRHFESIRARKDGTLVPVSLTISPIRHASGNVTAAWSIARDIIERQRAEEVRFRLAAIVGSRRRRRSAGGRAAGSTLPSSP